MTVTRDSPPSGGGGGGLAVPTALESGWWGPVAWSMGFLFFLKIFCRESNYTHGGPSPSARQKAHDKGHFAGKNTT